MSPTKVLRINVAAPCNAKWDEMSLEKNGRYCSSCKKVVVDFSNLSDQQLYNYFSKVNTIPCGRFRNDQLNKTIALRNNRKSLWSDFYKIAAATLAFFSLKNLDASVISKKADTSISPGSQKKLSISFPDKIIISGNVKDEHGNNLEKAEVKFGDSLTVITDKNGKFEIEITNEKEIRPTLISFSFPGLGTEIRNYHPAMLTTTYEVILYHPVCCSGFTMGMPVTNDSIPGFSTIVIECDKVHELTKEVMSGLSYIANKLRNYPEARIDIIAYAGKKKEKSKSILFQPYVKIYFVEKEGISEDRLNLKIEKKQPEKQNTVEIKTSSQE